VLAAADAERDEAPDDVVHPPPDLGPAVSAVLPQKRSRVGTPALLLGDQQPE
jgi:hypothetical protein